MIPLLISIVHIDPKGGNVQQAPLCPSHRLCISVVAFDAGTCAIKFRPATVGFGMDAAANPKRGGTQERQIIIERVVRTYQQVLGLPTDNGQERPEINADQIIIYLQESLQSVAR